MIKLFGNIIKWIFIIIFFPISLVFVAYYRQKKERKEYRNKEESAESTTYNNVYSS